MKARFHHMAQLHIGYIGHAGLELSTGLSKLTISVSDATVWADNELLFASSRMEKTLKRQESTH